MIGIIQKCIKLKIMKITSKKTTGLYGGLWYGLLPAALLFLGLMATLPACSGDAQDKTAATPAAPVEAAPEAGQGQHANANEPAVGRHAETPAAGSLPQPAPGNQGGSATTPGAGADTDAAAGPVYTVLKWQGGVTVKGGAPQKGQKTRKEEVRFSKTSDALMVNNEKSETFFLVPEGYEDSEGDGNICAGQKCDPVLLPAPQVRENMKRLRDLLKSLHDVRPAGTGQEVKQVKSTAPRASDRPGIQNHPALPVENQVKPEIMNKPPQEIKQEVKQAVKQEVISKPPQEAQPQIMNKPAQEIKPDVVKKNLKEVKKINGNKR